MGCPDTDGDGWSDGLDDFPNEPSQHIDSDGDGYGDTQSGVNADNCQGTPADEIGLVDDRGCAPSERDGDYDGVMEDVDVCPNTPASEVFDVDETGCSESERDSDGDGAIDSVDAYPMDASQTIDSDGDGFGDNASGTNGDNCPSETGTSTGNLRGCIDSDGDSWADTEDIVPNIGTQWKDTDGDGYYDNFANSIWADDVMRINGSWPGELIPGARTLTVVRFMQMSCKTWKILAVLLTCFPLGKRKNRESRISQSNPQIRGHRYFDHHHYCNSDYFLNRDWRCSHTSDAKAEEKIETPQTIQPS